ncbi:MAG: SDR family oxidoreductase [Deltaproteobacteria bacterium]|nr:SDR family oxidoreductase [Deltaproteobacteria bacterium]
MEIRGAHALITGASAGIGLEFAKQLHQAGASVTLVARRVAAIQAQCDQFNALRVGSARAVGADLTARADMQKVIEYIRGQRIDILVNNAGRGSFGYFEELDIEDEISEIELNVSATLRLAHAVIPQMKARRMGAIISLSSVAGFQPIPYMATYCATKAFNFFHSMALRHELKEFGVRVLTVCPGPTETEFSGVARVPGQPTGARRDSVEAVVSESLRALRANKPFVVTGLRSKLMVWGSRLTPKEISTWLTKKMLASSLKSKKQ